MTNQIAIITGATSGIGKSSAKIFAQNGYNLIITGRREERLIELKSELEAEFKVEVDCLNFDVQDRNALRIAIESIKSKLPNVKFLINNAGLALGRSPFDTGLESDWETMIDTNVKGLIYMTKEIVPYMIANKSGHIINISSTAARDMYVGGNVYSATKSAIDAFSQSLRMDLLPHQIKVSTVAPGMVETEFSLVRFHGDESKANPVYQGFEPLKPEDVADTIYYIASRPAHVHIGDVLMTCTAQANSTMVLKKIGH
jgi:3-hydroxy acid dehydrogenase / malonic semialdehyde reductase